jgi:hypothetical protein
MLKIILKERFKIKGYIGWQKWISLLLWGLNLLDSNIIVNHTISRNYKERLIIIKVIKIYLLSNHSNSNKIIIKIKKEINIVM